MIGFSINFLVLNFIGFFYYTAYNIFGYYFVATFSAEVHFSDLLFAVHALILVCFQLMLLFYYPRKSTNTLSPIWGTFGFLCLSKQKIKNRI